MPGKKSLAKQEKQQADKGDKKPRGKKEKIIGSLNIPDTNSNEVLDTLKRMKAITPNGVASQFNLKVSVAKKMLNDLEGKGVISMVSKSRNLKVYTFLTN
jgi:small subunit ribosomal protein S25e